MSLAQERRQVGVLVVQDELDDDDREVFEVLSPYRSFESAEQLR